VLTSVSFAAAQGMCIDDKAKAALNACAQGGPKEFDVGKHGKAPVVNFHSVAPPSDLKKKDDMKKPGNPTLDIPRDDRTSRLKARQRALLVTEIQGLEQLFAQTGRNASDRVTLGRRMAEDYVELESAAFRDKTQAEINRDGAKKNNPSQAGQFQTQANQSDGVMKAARNKAVQYYTLVKNDYPNYPQLDEVLYYLAYEYEQGSDYTNARKVYYELIQKRPDSKYVPNAYLAFGELFFNEAQGDPSKFDLAAKAYQEVIKYPPPNNKVFGYAHYKLGYVFWNQGDFAHAINEFKKTIDFGNAYAQLPGATKLAESARKDIIPVYALSGDPDKAYNFFKGISGDQGGSNDKTFKMMDDLGNNYLDTGHYPEAITLYHDLLNRDRGGKSCVYQAHITEATMAMKSNNKDAIRAELDNQLKIYDAFKQSGQWADQKPECANKTAALITETAMAWHLEAVGSQGQRGTGDQKTMSLAAYLYKKAGDTWSAQEFSQFQFPRIVKDDWPTIYKIKYAMADLLYFQERWGECGPAFDSVVAENPTAPEAPEAAYASVLCYQKIYDQMHAHGEGKKGSGNLPGQGDTKKNAKEDEEAKLRPKEFSDSQKGMLSAFNRYICYIKPAANDSQGMDQLVEVKYARARTYFEAQHWEESAVTFREIAMENSDKDVGIYAAQLYLESINIVGSHSNPPRPGCYDDMGTDVPKFVELYCSGDKATKNAEQCTTLNKVAVDLLRLKAQKLVELADKSQGMQSLSQYEAAGNSYFEMFRKYCQDPVANGATPQAERCDEIAYNAAKSFQAARLLAKAIAARKALLDFDAKTNGKSPLAKKATYEIGGNYQAIAVYELAADWFEKYQKADPRADKADQALSDAVLLRLGLGQDDQAIDDAKTFTSKYGASKQQQTAQIAFAVGSHYADKEDWAQAKSSLSGSMGVIDKAAPDIRAQAHAALARVLKQYKDGGPQAKGEYAKVRALWNDPAAAEAAIRAAYPSEDAASQDKRLAKALNAVGEAYFAQAEEARRTQVDPIKFPEYHGPGTKDDVLKHINNKVKDWYVKKTGAIEKVEPEYVKILELKPVPPPRWVIAAGSRAGLMWGDFVEDFRRAPIPDAWKKDAEIRGTYYDALDAASEPFKVKHAKPALEKCLKLSVQYQYFDEFSRSCEVWLARNYKAEYHVVDELRGAPTLVNSGLDEHSPPVLVGGSFWHPTVAAPDKGASGGSGGGDAKGGGDSSGGSSAGSSSGGDTPKPKGKGKGGRK
jgi:TolA-binding protein